MFDEKQQKHLERIRDVAVKDIERGGDRNGYTNCIQILDKLHAPEKVKDELREIACWELVRDLVDPTASFEILRGHRLPKIPNYLPDDFGHRLQSGTAPEVMISLAELCKKYGLAYEYWAVLGNLYDRKGLVDLACEYFNRQHELTFDNHDEFLVVFASFRENVADKVPSVSDLAERRSRLAQTVRNISLSDL
jgi:hypothetical protein